MSHHVHEVLLIPDVGAFVDNTKAVIPWAHLSSSPSSWIMNWDNSIVVREPTKMKKNELIILYQYLLDRQTNGDHALEWVNRNDADASEGGAFNKGGKGKDKVAEVDSDFDHSESEYEAMLTMGEDDKMSIGEKSGSGSSGLNPGKKRWRSKEDDGKPGEKMKRPKKDASQYHNTR